MNPKRPTPPRRLPDFDPDLEDDAVWTTLGQASQAEPSPRFTSDTLRRLRLERDATAPRWWQKLLSPKPLIATSATALAAVAILLSLPETPPSSPPQTAGAAPDHPAAVEDWENLEDTLARELLTEAAEDPTLLSDEEIVSLLY